MYVKLLRVYMFELFCKYKKTTTNDPYNYE